MFREAAAAPDAVRSAIACESRPGRAARRGGAKHGAACRRHLRTRQLRPRGYVREVPGRDPHGSARLVRGAVDQLGVRVKGGSRRRPVHCDLAIRREPRPARCRGSGQGCGCARARARQRGGLSACAHRPSHRSTARRCRSQCRSHQVVHRIARGDRASGRALDAGPRTPAGAGAGAGSARARLAARLGRRDRAPPLGRQSLSSSVAGSGWASRRRPRSSSRRPAGCTPRRSVPRKLRHGPMALVRSGISDPRVRTA